MRTIPINRRPVAAAGVVMAAVVALGGCGPTPAPARPGVVEVVAAENIWGSIAAQLGGQHAHVASIVSSPDADPHAYEATPQDARQVAAAQYMVVNGAGYDTWAQKLRDADGDSGPTVLDVATLAGRRVGDNPHMWYSPSIVTAVARRISDDLARIDPNDRAYFAQRLDAFTHSALARYDALRAEIRRQYHGVPIGATESLVVDLAADLGLALRTPPSFMTAISEGDDPTPEDTATAAAQIAGREIRVLVFNSQNSTPDVQRLVDAATAAHIPVVEVTETLSPAEATFQDWQTAQLQALLTALGSATT